MRETKMQYIIKKDMLPKIKALINSAEQFEANQMIDKALNYCMNASLAISEMDSSQLEEFQRDLIGVFKHKGWLV